MKTKIVTAEDKRDIKLAVDKILELGSMSDDQITDLGITPESLARNRNAIASSVRASGMQFVA